MPDNMPECMPERMPARMLLDTMRECMPEQLRLPTTIKQLQLGLESGEGEGSRRRRKRRTARYNLTTLACQAGNNLKQIQRCKQTIVCGSVKIQQSVYTCAKKTLDMSRG